MTPTRYEPTTESSATTLEMPGSTPRMSGLALRYYDENGVELVSPGDASRIARVIVAARGVVRVALSGMVAVTDSQAVGVRVRNR